MDVLMILSTLSHSVWCVSVLLLVVGAVHAVLFNSVLFIFQSQWDERQSFPPAPHFGFSRPRLNPLSVCVCVCLCGQTQYCRDWMLGCHLRTRSALVCVGLFLRTFLPFFFTSLPFTTRPPAIRSAWMSASICFISTCAQSPICKRCLSLLTCPFFTLETSHHAVTQDVVVQKKMPACFPVCMPVLVCVSIFIKVIKWPWVMQGEGEPSSSSSASLLSPSRLLFCSFSGYQTWIREEPWSANMEHIFFPYTPPPNTLLLRVSISRRSMH